ncbi:MAG: glycine--tRNA ligase subunit beta [Legionella sp.]|nr:MAG: glycine--tRNA ligase subunit beta [Legionella sp.]
MVSDFIFELGCEELPSAAVAALANEFQQHFLALLDKAQLSYGEVKAYATPRRIALAVFDLQGTQSSQTMTRRGPALAAAFDASGKPTPALLGFAKSCGVEVAELTQLKTDKGEWMVSEVQTEGKRTQELLPALVTQALSALSIAKPMRWGKRDDEFARPVHWAVLLFGEEVIPHEIFGVTTGRLSKGHRFHHPQDIAIKSARSYEEQMQAAFVIADFAKRRQLIQKQVQDIESSINAQAIMPEDLLDEVTSIVEWPQALLAQFEEEFLEAPAEALIASMQAHQKCFALKNEQNHLLAQFIAVSNISSTNAKQVILGNEKVMRARLSDALFFFRQDKKQPLTQHIPALSQVVFQTKLGSLQDKVQRVQALMTHLIPDLGLDAEQANRAVSLSKCDLLTGMVGEFPELQGLMGYYYALNDGEDTAVAVALNEQYMPRFAADQLPQSNLGLALSLADRIDTLVGIFAIGQKPSGVKDPFKLRRHALAVVRLLIATPAPLHLSVLIDEGASHFNDQIKVDKALIAELKPFILDRLNAYYQSQNVGVDLVQAVRARQDEWLFDMDKRLNALKDFITLPEAAALSAACKRVNNLLQHAGSKTTTHEINEELLENQAERDLYIAIKQMTDVVDPLYREGEYSLLLKKLASLKEPVDVFFEQVMVMVDDEAVKKNRLGLLQRLQQLLQGVADISILQI